MITKAINRACFKLTGFWVWELVPPLGPWAALEVAFQQIDQQKKGTHR